MRDPFASRPLSLGSARARGAGRGALLSALLLGLALEAGCAKSAKFDEGMGGEADLAGSEDQAADVDLRDDLAGGEDLRLPVTADLTMSMQDLSVTMPPDLAMSMPDLSAPRDMSANPPDMTMPRDLAPAPDLAPITGCEVVPQGGCLAGQKCTTHDATTSICDPNGTVARGKPCTVAGDIDDCAAGNICIDEGSSKSQCRAFCKTDAQCNNARSFCDFDIGASMKFKVCTQPCNAIYPGAGCEPGLGCFAYGREHTDCRPPGTMDAGQPCGDAFDCKGGLACVGPAGASLCRRVCRKGDDSACGGLFCFGVTSGAFSWPTYGVCCPLIGC